MLFTYPQHCSIKLSLRVKFQEEDDLDAMGSAVGLKHTLNLNKIGLVE